MTAYASRAPVDAERASEYKQQRSSSHDSAGPWGHAHFSAAHSRSAIDSGAMQCIHMIVVLLDDLSATDAVAGHSAGGVHQLKDTQLTAGHNAHPHHLSQNFRVHPRHCLPRVCGARDRAAAKCSSAL